MPSSSYSFLILENPYPSFEIKIWFSLKERPLFLENCKKYRNWEKSVKQTDERKTFKNEMKSMTSKQKFKLIKMKRRRGKDRWLIHKNNSDLSKIANKIKTTSRRWYNPCLADKFKAKWRIFSLYINKTRAKKINNKSHQILSHIDLFWALWSHLIFLLVSVGVFSLISSKQCRAN